MLDALGVGALQYPQVCIVGNVFRRLATAKACGKEAHQFTIIMFHDGTWRHPAWTAAEARECVISACNLTNYNYSQQHTASPSSAGKSRPLVFV
ncbi:hypothetical protein D3C75_1111000 [compost metagenome]